MGFKITYKSSVAKDCKRFPKKDVAQIFDKVDAELVEHPDRFPVLSGKFAGMRKLRAGNYRVIYVILDTAVLVLRIQHRKDVYRN
ncbi:MAG: type II toxin-antitoxin system RelE/ParE family toxin [Phycisphaerales bacterium]|nr:type II toxin-antitoxin system RelE/ParE family toxin [Phycisphaerales bacterium]MBT7171064.1 type II toxin-antitoxin system RelE/ParE family toxin [Phycisphaerales bacterium]